MAPTKAVNQSHLRLWIWESSRLTRIKLPAKRNTNRSMFILNSMIEVCRRGDASHGSLLLFVVPVSALMRKDMFVLAPSQELPMIEIIREASGMVT